MSPNSSMKAPPAPVLIVTIHLCGVACCSERQRRKISGLLENRTIGLVSKGFPENQPQNVVHTIQAEILLSYYFPPQKGLVPITYQQITKAVGCTIDAVANLGTVPGDDQKVKSKRPRLLYSLSSKMHELIMHTCQNSS
jgi:hypothetical protein